MLTLTEIKLKIIYPTFSEKPTSFWAEIVRQALPQYKGLGITISYMLYKKDYDAAEISAICKACGIQTPSIWR